MPGVPRHFALEGSTLYHIAWGRPRQNPPLLGHCMGLPWQIHKACPALWGLHENQLKAPLDAQAPM